MCDEPSYGQYAEWDGLCEEAGMDDTMASYYAEQEALAEATADGQVDAPPLSRESIWQCYDGTRLPIKDMETSHLLNTIRCLLGKSPHGTVIKTGRHKRKHLIQVMCNEVYRRGETLPADIMS
jgi:hypothetical protein